MPATRPLQRSLPTLVSFSLVLSLAACGEATCPDGLELVGERCVARVDGGPNDAGEGTDASSVDGGVDDAGADAGGLDASGPTECTAGDTRECGPDSKEGLCQLGTERCVEGRWSGSCLGAVVPAEETCNAKDDDCDGDIDEEADCPFPGCTPHAAGERVYYYCEMRVDFDEAKATCETYGYQLAEVGSAAEDAFIGDFIDASRNTFLGARLDGTKDDGTWRWESDRSGFSTESGVSVGRAYTAWTPTQPSYDDKDPAFCLGVRDGVEGWLVVECWKEYYFLCEPIG